MSWLGKELETTICCVTGAKQPIWGKHLSWIKYAHNSLVSSATSKSLFECSLGY